MFQFLENPEAFAVETLCFAAIPPFPRQGSEISQRPGNAPAVTELPKNRQALLIQPLCGLVVTLLSRDIPLRVQRPSDARAIFQSLEDCKALRMQRARVVILALQL